MQSGAECKKKIFSIPLNPKLTMEQFTKFYDEVAKYKDYIYDIYFTSRVPPFVQDAMGDVFDGNQASDLIHNAMIFQTQLGIPLSATFNNIECPPREDMLDMWIKNFRPLYDSGIRTVTLPHTIWLLSGKIQQEYPELFIKNTILRNVQRPNELVELVKAGFSYINLDRDLMRDRERLLEMKRAKEYCIKEYGRDVKVSLLANEHCWGNCPVQDEHFQYNNTRRTPYEPTYFMTPLSQFTCPAWDRRDPGYELKKANLPPWREDWVEFIDELGIDVFKMHGREHIPRLFETMQIIKNFAEGKELMWDTFDDYIDDMKLEGTPINNWRKKIKTCKFDCWDCNYCEKVVVGKSRHRLIEHIKTSLDKAERSESKISPATLKIPGLTSNKIKHFMNNMLSASDARYVEIGSFHGAIFASAIDGNYQSAAIAIDNFSNPEIEPMRDIPGWTAEQGNPKDILEKNIANQGNILAKIVDKDAFTVVEEDLNFKINMMFYDGDHSYSSHVKVLDHYYDMFDPIFVYIVDDWNWGQVEQATLEGIAQKNLKIRHQHIINTKGEDPDDYWNGIGIFVLEKQDG